MLEFTPKSKNRPATQTELVQRIQSMDDWQARLVLSFIDTLFQPETQPAEEMEAAA